MEMAELLAKAEVLGTGDRTIPASHRIEEDPFASQYGTEVIEPPLPLTRLVEMPELSNILNQCIEAMETNIDGSGYTLVARRIPEQGEDYSEEEMEERRRVERFFRFCNPEMSFTDIRRATRKDLETTGNAFWELLRNGKGELVGIVHVPSYTVRLTRLDRELTPTHYKVLDEGGHYETIEHVKRFRRYVQIVGGKKVYWKEYGDARPIDALTGEPADGDTKRLANEMIHWRIYSPRSPYGIPRWAGNILAVLGSRAAEEINYAYFDNKSVPPLAILVSGGHLAEGVRERLEDYVEEQLKGRSNFHKMLILEAEGSNNGPLSVGPQGNVKIDMKPLTNLIQQDALFMRYDEANREKIRSSFRLPPLYVGLAKDFNRATAEEAREIAEAQVFGPERDAFDFVINHRIFPVLDVVHWEFKTLVAPQENPDKESAIIKRLAPWLTGAEVRRMIEQVLHVDLAELEGEWLSAPLQLYLAQNASSGGQVLESQDAQPMIDYLLKVRKALDDDTALD